MARGTPLVFAVVTKLATLVCSMPWNGETHGLTQLTLGEGFHGDPAWSPTGDSIAIESDWGNYPADEGIWSIPASDPDGVTREEGAYAAHPERFAKPPVPPKLPTAAWINEPKPEAPIQTKR
jgi:Tol biopolymer transport system component